MEKMLFHWLFAAGPVPASELVSKLVKNKNEKGAGR